MGMWHSKELEVVGPSGLDHWIHAGLVFGFLGMLAVLFGIVVTGYDTVQTSREEARWPSTPGVISESKPRAVDSSVGSFLQRFNGSFDGVAIEYAYSPSRGSTSGITVEAERPEHWGSRLSSGWLAGSAEELLRKYPAGARVWVHYNPSWPGNAYLERGSVLKQLLLLLVAGVAAVGAWLLPVKLFDRRLQRKLRAKYPNHSEIELRQLLKDAMERVDPDVSDHSYGH